ncbi:MAG: transcriptional regulator NrdR [Tissierellia bacterium]|nr:transcriptional regulator NrdR [Tissierellia bacterium]
MKCPYCGYRDTKVVDSRPTEDDMSIRRRRSCIECNRRFTTYERYEEAPLIVIKKDNTREPFERQKIFNGMLRSCEKRPVSVQELERATDQIEVMLNDLNLREVKSTKIGEMVMDKLRSLDKVAYIRFASVYREFEDIGGFYDELENLKKD